MRRVSEMLKPLCVTGSFFFFQILSWIKHSLKFLSFQVVQHDCEKGEMFPIW